MHFFVVMAVFAAVSLSVQSAYAAPAPTQSARPGWGSGDPNHVHAGPPGLSVRNNTNISIGTWITAIADGGAQISIGVYNTISDLFD
ncbi:MAG: hypothetical protein AAB553_01670 [Patescibacteria group bacterium]